LDPINALNLIYGLSFGFVDWAWIRETLKDSRDTTTMKSGEFVVISDYDVRTKREKRWSLLSQLLADPILADALRNPTLSYVVTLVSLEKGSAMRLSIVKLDGSSLGNVLLYWHFVEHLVCIVDLHLFIFLLEDVAVMNSATLKDLKIFDQEES
ncbi:unnamed protein product, partial [Brassica oleracea]